MSSTRVLSILNLFDVVTSITFNQLRTEHSHETTLEMSRHKSSDSCHVIRLNIDMQSLYYIIPIAIFSTLSVFRQSVCVCVNQGVF